MNKTLIETIWNVSTLHPISCKPKTYLHYNFTKFQGVEINMSFIYEWVFFCLLVGLSIFMLILMINVNIERIQIKVSG